MKNKPSKDQRIEFSLQQKSYRQFRSLKDILAERQALADKEDGRIKNWHYNAVQIGDD